MKNVYFVQPNNSLSSSLFLPYAVGSIAAYSFSHEEICSRFTLCDFIFTKDPVEEAVKRISNPYIVGFSCYMWNVEYNLSLAEEIKKKYPSAITVFGGPQIPDDTEYLKNYGFIDILIHGEGETAFYEMLKGEALDKIANISFRKGAEIFKTPSEPICDLSLFPSPYSSGLFDSIINDPKYAGVQFDAIIETNRGCPFKCIYCCWGDRKESFRLFPYERIKKDLEWIAKNKIAFCICADSNFGIADRDEEIAEYIVELKKKYGYPQKFETTAAKNKDEHVFRINQKLHTQNLNRGISVAVQSMSKEVLEIIGRKNISVDNLSYLLEKYRNAGMYTYTDIILGLPGETLESFCNGLFDVIEAGQHYSININRCEFLPNTPMYSKEYTQRYKIKTIRSYLCQNHSKVVNDTRYGSRSELVVETSTMSRRDWRKAIRLSTCVQSFHCMGMLRMIAVYLRRAHGITYHDFYMNLFEWIESKSSFIKKQLDYVCASIDTFLEGKSNMSFDDKRFGDIYWSFEEALFLCSAYGCEEFFEEAGGYILSHYPDFSAELSDLLLYQKSILVLPAQNDKTVRFNFDWPKYFENIFDKSKLPPDNQSITLKIGGNDINSWPDYGRLVIWYGKRDDKGINKSISYLT